MTIWGGDNIEHVRKILQRNNIKDYDTLQHGGAVLGYERKKMKCPGCGTEIALPKSVEADYLGTSEGVLYIYIKKIREKIEENPSNPVTLLHVRGKGYILRPARTEAAK